MLLGPRDFSLSIAVFLSILINIMHAMCCIGIKSQYINVQYTALGFALLKICLLLLASRIIWVMLSMWSCQKWASVYPRETTLVLLRV